MGFFYEKQHKKHQKCILYRTMVFNPLSTIFQLNRAVSFIGEGNLSTLKKTTDLPQITDKLYHIKLYQVHLDMGRIGTHNVRGDGN